MEFGNFHGPIWEAKLLKKAHQFFFIIFILFSNENKIEKKREEEGSLPWVYDMFGL